MPVEQHILLPRAGCDDRSDSQTHRRSPAQSAGSSLERAGRSEYSSPVFPSLVDLPRFNPYFVFTVNGMDRALVQRAVGAEVVTLPAQSDKSRTCPGPDKRVVRLS